MNHGALGKRKGKEAYLYSAFYILCISQSAQAWITQFYLQIHHACIKFKLIFCVCVFLYRPLLYMYCMSVSFYFYFLLYFYYLHGK